MNDEPNNESLSRRILATIDREHVSPRPRWEYILKNYVFWTLGALAVVLGALAFSAALFEVENAGWNFYIETHGSFIDFFFDAAPFLWAGVLALFLLIGYINIRRTRSGYRYPLTLIALGAVMTSIMLGIAVYAAGFSRAIEQGIGDHPPFYRPIITEERAWWDAPQKGLLGGSVVSVAPGSFVLKDFSGRLWTIDSTGIGPQDAIVVVAGGTVRIVGMQIATSTLADATSTVFTACFVFPWHVDGDPRILPPPAASSSEIIPSSARSEQCKDIRPYTQLRALDDSGF